MIKVFLVFGLMACGIVVLRRRGAAGHLVLRRVTFLAVLVMGIMAILLPDLVTKVANKAGVGRGTDLLLYALVLSFLFVSVGLYQRLNELESRYVRLARKIAILQASGDGLSNGPPNFQKHMT